MKRLPVSVLLLASLALGCAGMASRPPKASPEEVKLFDPELGQFPEEGYKTLGPVKAERRLGTPQAELLLALRAEGARVGADAVILQRIRRSAEGDIESARSDREEMVIAEGLAIYWPPKQ